MNINVRKLLVIALILAGGITHGQNPIISNQYAADPSARVFGDSVYLYPSHDIVATEGKGRLGWFCMEDYHVFSSQNLTDWTDRGVIVSQNKVSWVKPDSYSMWAPDCIERNGKFYFYFPTVPSDSATYGKGFRIGVAVSDKPTGPFIPEPAPLKDVRGIDPNIFIDKDGQAYLYWSAGNIYAAKLKPSMLEIDSPVKTLGELPPKGLKEGPYLFERNGRYYLTYPHVANKIERLEYAMGDNPLGPFSFTGVIMDESPTGCWTNHHSIIEYKNQWYLFYHHNDYSPAFDKSRSVRVDSLFFNTDGTIQKVRPTLRGVGITGASKKIQMDRYTAISDTGARIDFVDTADRFKGWKTIFNSPGAWIQYDKVDFSGRHFKTVLIKAMSETGGRVQIHARDNNGPLLAEINIAKTKEWKLLHAILLKAPAGMQDLVLVLKGKGMVATDWIAFQ